MIDVLPDVLQDDLVVVFCGTAASTVSAREGAYYANASNAFWRALHQTGMTPRRYAPREFPRLLELRIGLTDVAKRAAGSDSSLRQSDFRPDCLSEKIRRHRPQIVAFTSKAAWRAWRRLSPQTQFLMACKTDAWARPNSSCCRRRPALPAAIGTYRIGRHWLSTTGAGCNSCRRQMRVYRNAKLRALDIYFKAPRAGDAGYDLFAIADYSIDPGSARWSIAGCIWKYRPASLAWSRIGPVWLRPASIRWLASLTALIAASSKS